MSRSVVELVLGSAVATSGTFTVGYPAGKTKGNFISGTNHRLTALQSDHAVGKGFTIALGTSVATITWLGTTTIPSGSRVWVELDETGADYLEAGKLPIKSTPMAVLSVDLGSPAAADPNGLVTGYTGAAGVIPLDGALVAADGSVTFDVARGLVVDSGGADTAVITGVGYDDYEQLMVESITLNGTTAVLGKKAFKKLVSLTSSASIANGAFIGTSDVLGLPFFLDETAQLLVQYQDGALNGSGLGTYVAGSQAAGTATSGDVRGTLDPTTAMDGIVALRVVALVDNPGYRGAPQFAG
jgi:hypothetical protein